MTRDLSLRRQLRLASGPDVRNETMLRALCCVAATFCVLVCDAGVQAAPGGETVAVTGTPGSRSYRPRWRASRQVATPAQPAVVTVDDVRAMIVSEAVTNRIVPPELALAVAREESNFNPNAESPAGARGVMQIMPATALGEFAVDPELLWNARVNIWIGITHLEQLFSRYGQNWEAALSHYNGGALRSDGAGELAPHPFTRTYVASVMRRWNQYAVDPAVARLVASARSGRMSAPAATPARKPARPAPAPAVVAVTGSRPATGLRGDIEEARASFRRAMQARRVEK